jgi:hypothetical protein
MNDLVAISVRELEIVETEEDIVQEIRLKNVRTDDIAPLGLEAYTDTADLGAFESRIASVLGPYLEPNRFKDLDATEQDQLLNCSTLVLANQAYMKLTHIRGFTVYEE